MHGWYRWLVQRMRVFCPMANLHKFTDIVDLDAMLAERVAAIAAEAQAKVIMLFEQYAPQRAALVIQDAMFSAAMSTQRANPPLGPKTPPTAVSKQRVILTLMLDAAGEPVKTRQMAAALAHFGYSTKGTYSGKDRLIAAGLISPAHNGYVLTDAGRQRAEQWASGNATEDTPDHMEDDDYGDP